jgi:thiamine-monophosphate kinase
MKKNSGRPGEFEIIKTYFSPLSRRHPGAFGLTDDVAVLAPPAGHDVVLKTDAIVEGIHFNRSDPPDTVAKKALRANISDFAAKGATPSVYLLALALPDWPDGQWLEQFAKGLAEDQAEFDVTLAGGDTNRTPGALTVAVTMIGFVPQGTVVRRSGAKLGEVVFVTGTIGDAGAGLALLKRQADACGAAEEDLISRYRVPRPRLAFGRRLRGVATAALDVSDGLIADLGHVAEVSHVRIEVDAVRVPLSEALVELRGRDISAIAEAATAGDDYEIAFCAPASCRPLIERIADETNTPVTEVGRATAGEGVALVDAQGHEIKLERCGYTHF